MHLRDIRVSVECKFAFETRARRDLIETYIATHISDNSLDFQIRAIPGWRQIKIKERKRTDRDKERKRERARERERERERERGTDRRAKFGRQFRILDLFPIARILASILLTKENPPRIQPWTRILNEKCWRASREPRRLDTARRLQAMSIRIAEWVIIGHLCATPHSDRITIGDLLDEGTAAPATPRDFQGTSDTDWP